MLALASSCGQKSNPDNNTELYFRESSATVKLKDDLPLPFVAKEMDFLDIKLDLDDFYAFGYVSEDAVKISAKHVGETIAIISYGSLKSECKITIEGLLDARFLGTPSFLEFGADYNTDKNSIPGVHESASGNHLAEFQETDWSALVNSNWNKSSLSINYYFSGDNKLEYICANYNLPYDATRYYSAYRTFSDVLSERYKYLSNSLWQLPGRYFVRVKTNHKASYYPDFDIELHYAKDEATLNKYCSPGRD